MSKKKLNPRRIPLSKAALEQAKNTLAPKRLIFCTAFL